MKKIVFFMLIIMSLSLYSQQDVYWKKVDFDFGSGVKLIHIYQGYSYDYNQKTPFLVATDNNELFYFSDLNTEPIKIDLPEKNLSIQKIRLIGNPSKPTIFLLANQKLFSLHFDLDWVNISRYNNFAGIIDFEFTKTPSSNFVICITERNEAYISEDFGFDWRRNDIKLDNDTLSLLSSEQYNIYCHTKNNNNFTMSDYSDKKEWNFNQKIETKNEMVEFRVFDEYDLFPDIVFLDSKSKLYHKRDSLILINSDTATKITCYTNMYMLFLTANILNEYLPYFSGTIFGTMNKGVYFYDYDEYLNNSQIRKLGNELDGYTITDIETNVLCNPNVCLVGTKENGLYYGEWEEPKDVKDKSSNTLQTQIYPQPASDKAILNFNLPHSSQVSIKLFNTLGIEVKTIAEKYCNEGANSIPLDLTDLPNGVYFVAIDYQGERVVEKLIVGK